MTWAVFLLIAALAGMVAWNLRLKQQLSRALQTSVLADVDALTGLLNQSAFMRRTESSTPFGGIAAVCDLDGFKSVNDRFGHSIGDDVLRSVGKLIKASVRAEDQAYRWGGDEFVILFEGNQVETVAARMQAISDRLADFHFRGDGAVVISISWGLAVGAGLPLRQAVDLADRSMYESKMSERDSRATST